MLRKRLFPKTVSDFCAVTFLLVMIQVIYWFELFQVLPEHFADNDIAYSFHCLLSTWFLFNIVSNFVVVFLTDTSIFGRVIPVKRTAGWRLCEVCESVTPPRTWHCSVCNVCTLKRDHHCNFTACCVGHDNHRYFILFLVYLSAATLYCAYFNAQFLWRHTHFTLVDSLKLVFPVAILIFGQEPALIQLYRLFCVITIVGTMAASSLCLYHLMNVWSGQVMHERAKSITLYQLDPFDNIRQVLGRRWYLTWISPFVESELPCDGIHWDKVASSSQKSK